MFIVVISFNVLILIYASLYLAFKVPLKKMADQWDALARKLRLLRRLPSIFTPIRSQCPRSRGRKRPFDPRLLAQWPMGLVAFSTPRGFTLYIVLPRSGAVMRSSCGTGGSCQGRDGGRWCATDGAGSKPTTALPSSCVLHKQFELFFKFENDLGQLGGTIVQGTQVTFHNMLVDSAYSGGCLIFLYYFAFSGITRSYTCPPDLPRHCSWCGSFLPFWYPSSKNHWSNIQTVVACRCIMFPCLLIYQTMFLWIDQAI